MFEEPAYAFSTHVRVTLARAFTNTFTGIRLQDVPMFWAAQLTGAATATLLFRWLVPSLPESAEPHEASDR